MESKFRLLIQNCDLPPPVKIYHGLVKGEEILKEEKIQKTDSNCWRDDYDDGDDEDEEKLGLTKALRLSQTRAREAEKRRLCLAKEKEMVCERMIWESLRASAYRNWVRVLELHVRVLKSRMDRQEEEGDDDDEEEEGMIDWAIFSLGVSVGIALVAWMRLF